MSKLHLFLIFFVFLLAFTACQSQPTPSPTPTAVAQLPTATTTQTATFTAVPPTTISTNTSTPTPIITLTASPTTPPTPTPVSLVTLEPMTLPTVEPTPADQPQLTLVAQEGGSLTSMAVENGRLYTNEGAQLVILDISDPAAPVELGRSEFLPFIPQQMAAVEGVLYVGANSQLQVWDVRNPAGITLLNHYQLPGHIQNLWSINQEIWLYWQPYQLANGLIPDPVLSQVVEGQLLNSMAVDTPQLQLKGGFFGYLSEENEQKTFWQLSLAEKLVQPVLTVSHSIADFAFYGSELHLISYQNEWMVYEQTPAGWQFKREIEAEGDLFVVDIEIIGSLAYVADRFCEGGCSGYVSVYELTPDGVQFLAKTGVTYRQSIVYEEKFYLQHNNDISFLAWENGAWVKTGLFGAKGPVNQVLITDNYLWQVRNGGLLQSLLVNGLPTNTVSRPFYVDYRDPQVTLTTSEQYVITANPDSGVILFPFAPPTTTIEPYHIPQYAGFVAKQQGSLLAVLTIGGVKVWDITEPINPTLLKDLPSEDYFSMKGFFWQKSNIYILQNTDNNKTLTAWDFTIPTDPLLLDELDLEETSYLIASFPGYLYLSTPTELLVIDVSNPAEMVITFRLPLGYQLGGMIVDNGRGYSLQGNLTIFDLSNPAEPQLLMETPFPNSIYGLAVNGQYLYVAAGDAGLLIFEQPIQD